jgi:hypothetical protein
MKLKTILLALAFVFLIALLAVCLFVTAAICNDCGVNFGSGTATAIEATNRQVEIWLTATAAAKTATAEKVH